MKYSCFSAIMWQCEKQKKISFNLTFCMYTRIPNFIPIYGWPFAYYFDGWTNNKHKYKTHLRLSNDDAITFIISTSSLLSIFKPSSLSPVGSAGLQRRLLRRLHPWISRVFGTTLITKPVHIVPAPLVPVWVIESERRELVLIGRLRASIRVVWVICGGRVWVVRQVLGWCQADEQQD